MKRLGIGEPVEILVMDDDQVIRTVVRRILSKAGYDVVCAADGDEAVGVYRQAKDAGKPFDVTVMDLTIPGGMGGKGSARCRRARISASSRSWPAGS
ncbi:MAG: response regulator [Chloroflexaceae bacterium]|nr:response regulator [Chloroflexaceae bacterium]